jgi:hypothetical protein
MPRQDLLRMGLADRETPRRRASLRRCASRREPRLASGTENPLSHSTIDVTEESLCKSATLQDVWIASAPDASLNV